MQLLRMATRHSIQQPKKIRYTSRCITVCSKCTNNNTESFVYLQHTLQSLHAFATHCFYLSPSPHPNTHTFCVISVVNTAFSSKYFGAKTATVLRNYSIESFQNFFKLQACINPYFVIRSSGGSDSHWASDKIVRLPYTHDSSCLHCQRMGSGPHLTTSASHGILICVSALVHFCAVK